MDRRRFLGSAVMAAVGTALLPGCTADPTTGPVEAVAQPTAPVEGPRAVRLGFTALTDCAPLVMAAELGYFAERELDVSLEKLSSWSAVRDALIGGQLDAAHCPFSLPLSLAAGVGGLGGRELRIAMTISSNGQGITLNQDYAQGGVGYGDLEGAREILDGSSATLAMPFPGGTNDVWLRYWLKATGADISQLQIISTPSSQMVQNMRVGNLVGYCDGEPWNTLAVQEGFGYTHLASQDLWRGHPEKALVVHQRLADERGDVLRELMGAVLQAAAWLDDPEHRVEAADVLATQPYLGGLAAGIRGRLLGRYDLGGGQPPRRYDDDQVQFCLGGRVNAPRRAHALWFLAQYQRFGFVAQEPPATEIVDELLLRDVYAEVASAEGLAVPDDDMAPFEVQLDGVTFDPAQARQEALRP